MAESQRALRCRLSSHHHDFISIHLVTPSTLATGEEATRGFGFQEIILVDGIHNLSQFKWSSWEMRDRATMAMVLTPWPHHPCLPPGVLQQPAVQPPSPPLWLTIPAIAVSLAFCNKCLVLASDGALWKWPCVALRRSWSPCPAGLRWLVPCCMQPVPAHLVPLHPQPMCDGAPL